MLRGCLFALGLWTALSYGYYLWLVDVFESPATYIVPIVVGFLTMCCIGAWNNAWTAWRDLARLRRARDGAMPRDGQVIAASGPIQPLKSALPTPFMHHPCVLCEWDIERERSTDSDSNSSPGSYYAGFMMIPCAIHTERGPIPLLGFPIVTNYQETRCGTSTAAQNARAFLTNTTFEDRSGAKMVTLFSVFGELWSDEDGTVFKNMRLTKTPVDELFPPELQQQFKETAANDNEIDEADDDSRDSTDDDHVMDRPDNEFEATQAWAKPKMLGLVEKYIPVGDQVTVFGVYQELTGGIGPRSRGGKPTRLFRRTSAEQEKFSRGSVIRNLVGGVIGLAVIHAMLFGVIWLYQHSEEGNRQKQRRAKQQPAAAARLAPSHDPYQRFVLIVPEVES